MAWYHIQVNIMNDYNRATEWCFIDFLAITRSGENGESLLPKVVLSIGFHKTTNYH